MELKIAIGFTYTLGLTQATDMRFEFLINQSYFSRNDRQSVFRTKSARPLLGQRFHSLQKALMKVSTVAGSQLPPHSESYVSILFHIFLMKFASNIFRSNASFNDDNFSISTKHTLQSLDEQSMWSNTLFTQSTSFLILDLKWKKN